MQNQQLYNMQDQQLRLLGMVESLSVSTQTALGGLDARLLALEAKMRASLPGTCISAGMTFILDCVTKSGLQYSFIWSIALHYSVLDKLKLGRVA